ncbi:5219_t:CDS:1, partial [Gigaspora margarita]
SVAAKLVDYLLSENLYQKIGTVWQACAKEVEVEIVQMLEEEQ